VVDTAHSRMVVHQDRHVRQAPAALGRRARDGARQVAVPPDEAVDLGEVYTVRRNGLPRCKAPLGTLGTPAFPVPLQLSGHGNRLHPNPRLVKPWSKQPAHSRKKRKLPSTSADLQATRIQNRSLTGTLSSRQPRRMHPIGACEPTQQAKSLQVL